MQTTTEMQALETREPVTAPLSGPSVRIRPAVDLIENENDFVMYVEMPGVDHNSVDLATERNVLSVKGTADFSSPSGSRLVSGEIGRRIYERSFQLSDDIDRNAIDAEIKHGVLRLTLPKSQGAKRMQVQVKGS